MKAQNYFSPAAESNASSSCARTFLVRRLRQFKVGTVEITLPDGAIVRHAGVRSGPAAVIRVLKWKFFWRLISQGEVGLGVSYVDGDWSTPDLSAVFSFGLANVSALGAAAGGWSFSHRVNGIFHRLRSNTLRGSRRNIAAHYDLGNSFYRHWLDQDMNYSSGIHADTHESLEVAQQRKHERIIDLLDIQGGENVLEIGCGWGALACRLAETEAGRITGLTLSSEQLAFANERLKSNLERDRIGFHLRDYRHVEQVYDRIVSIEMFEAVGERYWSVYFSKLRQCVKWNGLAVLQIITIAEDVFENYRQRPDFIQQYIFPGGMLPTVNIVRQEALRAGFDVESYESFGLSYAHTLRAWRERFHKAWPEISQLGFDDRFRRMWDYYLTYCEAGFNTCQTDVGLFKLVPR